jgi:hypothetical protein
LISLSESVMERIIDLREQFFYILNQHNMNINDIDFKFKILVLKTIKNQFETCILQS